MIVLRQCPLSALQTSCMITRCARLTYASRSRRATRLAVHERTLVLAYQCAPAARMLYTCHITQYTYMIGERLSGIFGCSIHIIRRSTNINCVEVFREKQENPFGSQASFSSPHRATCTRKHASNSTHQRHHSHPNEHHARHRSRLLQLRRQYLIQHLDHLIRQFARELQYQPSQQLPNNYGRPRRVQCHYVLQMQPEWPGSGHLVQRCHLLLPGSGLECYPADFWAVCSLHSKLSKIKQTCGKDEVCFRYADARRQLFRRRRRGVETWRIAEENMLITTNSLS